MLSGSYPPFGLERDAGAGAEELGSARQTGRAPVSV
jgi:hypothetical protein